MSTMEGKLYRSSIYAWRLSTFSKSVSHLFFLFEKITFLQSSNSYLVQGTYRAVAIKPGFIRSIVTVNILAKSIGKKSFTRKTRKPSSEFSDFFFTLAIAGNSRDTRLDTPNVFVLCRQRQKNGENRFGNWPFDVLMYL